MFSGIQSKSHIISLSSLGSGVGKDSVAEILVKHHGFTQFSWASELRRQVAKSFREHMEVPHNYLENSLHIIPDKFWEVDVCFGDALRSYENKRKIFVRNQQALQTFLRASNPEEKLVISDTRFPCEAEFLRSLDAKMILVEGYPRRGVFEYDNLLPSEVWDYKLNNFGELCELRKRVEVMLEYF